MSRSPHILLPLAAPHPPQLQRPFTPLATLCTLKKTPSGFGPSECEMWQDAKSSAEMHVARSPLQLFECLPLVLLGQLYPQGVPSKTA